VRSVAMSSIVLRSPSSVPGLAPHVLGQDDARRADVRAPAADVAGAWHRGLEAERARGFTQIGPQFSVFAG
jgi:hypothetical protein